MRKIETIVLLMTLNYFSITYGKQGYCKETEYQCRKPDEVGNVNAKCEPLSERDLALQPEDVVFCKKNCTENNYWCEPRGECISNREVCDCGKSQLMCVNDKDKKYMCEKTKNILISNLVEICTDGNCKKKDTCDKAYKKCKNGTFMCGTECREKGDVTTYRSCEGNCIPVGETCYKDEGEIEIVLPTFLEEIRSELGLDVPAMIGVSGGAGAGVVLFVGLCIFCLIRRKKKKNEIMWVETNSLYGDYQMGAVDEIVDRNVGYGYNDDGEMDDDAIIDHNPMYGYGD